MKACTICGEICVEDPFLICANCTDNLINDCDIYDDIYDTIYDEEAESEFRSQLGNAMKKNFFKRKLTHFGKSALSWRTKRLRKKSLKIVDLFSTILNNIMSKSYHQHTEEEKKLFRRNHDRFREMGLLRY